MRLTWGGYSHAENSVGFTISKNVQMSQRGLPFKTNHVWVINGVLRSTTQSDLTAQMAALEDAYKQNDQDLKFLFDNGGETHHKLLASSTISGTRVRSFNWLNGQAGVWGSNTEYVFRRSYRIIVDAESFADGADGILTSTESLTFRGTGGPRWVLAGSLTGPMQRQNVQLYTPFIAIQSGYALGLTAAPPFPGPLWPALEHGEMREETTISGIKYRNDEIAISSRWRYIHESSAFFV